MFLRIPTYFNIIVGRLVDFNLMEFKTSQFSLFKIIYEKMLIDKRRTLNPDEGIFFLLFVISTKFLLHSIDNL